MFHVKLPNILLVELIQVSLLRTMSNIHYVSRETWMQEGF